MRWRMFIAIVGALLGAAPAHALTITNLDSVPHTLIYDSAGAPEEQVVAPNQSIHFYGRPDGFLSLKTAGAGAKKPGSSNAVHADGILSGVLGASRSEDIPAAGNYEFTIWPGGRLRVQNHRNGNIF